MNPGETWKWSLGLTRDTDFQVVAYDGIAGRDPGPTEKDTLTISMARAISDRFSATLSLQGHRNSRPLEESRYSIGDPSLSGRLTLLQQTFVKPLVPQIQAFATYKQSVAKSVYDKGVESRGMDVHGNGLSEFVAGLDLWWGMESIKFGLAQTMIMPLERDFARDEFRTTITPGLGMKTTMSGGYNVIGLGTVLLSLDREERLPLAIDGELKAASEVLVHSMTVTGSYRVGPLQTAGITWKRTAAFSINRNTTRAQSISLGFMEAM
tara:strand:- start:301 stop:1098 length:798 start_codon:yes stop_codon:yes gene_type:complete